MAIINRSNIQSLLRPGQAAIFEDYNIYPQWWHNVYSRHRSNKAVEYETQMQSLGLASLKQDGAPVSMGTMQQAYTTSYVHQYFGIGFQITRAAILDNLYQSEFPMQNVALRNSLETVKNINAAYLFNNAFNPSVILADGQPLASTQHPTAVGTLANTFGGVVQFSEATVEDAITIIKGWTNVAGLQIEMLPQKTLVPQKLAFQAARIFKSEFRTDTPNNDINAIYHDKYMPQGYLVSQFLTNPYNWFILTQEPNGFKYYLREPLDIDYIDDITTDTLTVRAIERYSFNCSNWRAAFCAQG